MMSSGSVMISKRTLPLVCELLFARIRKMVVTNSQSRQIGVRYETRKKGRVEG